MHVPLSCDAEMSASATEAASQVRLALWVSQLAGDRLRRVGGLSETVGFHCVLSPGGRRRAAHASSAPPPPSHVHMNENRISQPQQWDARF